MPSPRQVLGIAVLWILALSLFALTAAAPAKPPPPPPPPAAAPPVTLPPVTPPPVTPPPVTPPPVTPPPVTPPPVTPAPPPATEVPPAPAPEVPAPEEPTEPPPAEPAPEEPAEPTEEEPAEEEPVEPSEEVPPAEPGIEGPEIDPVTGMPIGTPGYEPGPTGARGPAAGGGKRLATVGDEPSLSLAVPEEPEPAAPPPPSGEPAPPPGTTVEALAGSNPVGEAEQGALGGTFSARTGTLVLNATPPTGDGGGPIVSPPSTLGDTVESVVAAPFAAGAVGLAAGAVGSVVDGGGDESTSGTGTGNGAGAPGAGGGGENGSGAAGPLLPDDLGPVFGDGLNDLLIGVPDWVWILLAVLAVVSLLLALAYLLATLRARSLGRQRRELLQEVGLLQSALLPPVPDKLGGLRTSVAYRPADGPGAGGDFYDVLPLTGGAVGFILGDVSGHGRGALARTAFMRYTLRAYLEAGLEPRVALQVAGRVIDENLGGDFATVLLAVHDPDTGSLTYATAGHPAPIVIGPQPHQPVTAGSAPPIGVGVKTGLRQTTLPLAPGAIAALFTDGLMEARVDGVMLGRERLEGLLGELGDQATARGLIERVAQEAGKLSDDIAAVVVSPTVVAAAAPGVRTEQLELSKVELEGDMAERFLAACGVAQQDAAGAVQDARVLGERFGGAVMRVVYDEPMRVDVFPSNVETIESASRRSAAG